DPACPSPQGEFAPLQDQGEAVHMAFFGSAVPNSLLDLSVSTLVGPMHTVHLSLPGTTTAKDLDLPYGLVLGIATNFFGTNDPHGFMPLGMAAGLSAKDGHGGVVDSNCDPASNPCDPNVLHVKFAPENGGTEGSPAAIALLALNFGGLTPGSTTKIAISGQINAIANGDLAYTSPDKAAPKIPASSSFMKLPASGSIVATISTRNVTITGDADPGVQIYRFELTNAARLNWEFWLPPVGAA